MKVTIDRSKWLRGEGAAKSHLLEAELTQLFKSIGIELEFTDGGSIDR